MEIIDSYQVPKGFGEPAGTDNNSIVIGWFIFHLALLPLTSLLFTLLLLCFLLINIRLIFMQSCESIPVRTVYTILASSCIRACFLLRAVAFSLLAAFQCLWTL
jgi:multidrug transporter EmrE-like cation transporter